MDVVDCYVDLSLKEVIEDPTALLEKLDCGSFRELRWFSLKGVEEVRFEVVDFVAFPHGPKHSLLVLAVAEFTGRDGHLGVRSKVTTFLPMMVYFSCRDVGQDYASLSLDEAFVSPGATMLLEVSGKDFYARIVDASALPEYCRNVMNGISDEVIVSSRFGGCFSYRKLDNYRGFSNVDVFEVAKGESSNSLALARSLVLVKTARNISCDAKPEGEIMRDLRAFGGFESVPKVYGELCYEREEAWNGERLVLCTCQQYLEDAVSCFNFGLECLSQHLRSGEHDVFGFSDGSMMVKIGTLLAEMHFAMAKCNSESTCVNDVGAALFREFEEVAHLASEKVSTLEGNADDETISRLCEEFGNIYSDLMKASKEICGNFRDSYVSKCHQDMHLGQILISNGKLYVSDFEGEPMRSSYRKASVDTPLKDVASMLRSFSYLKVIALNSHENRTTSHEELLRRWEDKARKSFLKGYVDKGVRLESEFFASHNHWEASGLIVLFEVEKCLKEIVYELENRPEYVVIPLKHFKGLCNGLAGE